MNGLYKHEPVLEWRGLMYSNDLYWCFNWTFRPSYNEKIDKMYMVDTYYNDKRIELTDDNIDGFEFVFDFNEVHKTGFENLDDYDESDWWYVAVDSGGITYAKYFLKNDAKKNREKVIDRYKYEISDFENQLKHKKLTLLKIMNDEIDLDYV